MSKLCTRWCFSFWHTHWWHFPLKHPFGTCKYIYIHTYRSPVLTLFVSGISDLEARNIFDPQLQQRFYWLHFIFPGNFQTDTKYLDSQKIFFHWEPFFSPRSQEEQDFKTDDITVFAGSAPVGWLFFCRGKTSNNTEKTRQKQNNELIWKKNLCLFPRANWLIFQMGRLSGLGVADSTEGAFRALERWGTSGNWFLLRIWYEFEYN